MRTERWGEVRAIFEQVVDLDDAARGPRLAELCGDDDELAGELRSLLRENDRNVSVVSPLIHNAAAAVDDSHGPLPEEIGPYRVLEFLGRGGMGSVFLGERNESSFTQRVALKVLHSSLLDPEMVTRFRSERQILADLRHPGIARLIDGGATDDGLPYLAMEYVEGRRLDRWCDERRLTVDERIAVFRDVCAAVQAAHRSLVVHRDLKPANILVTDDGHVKLLDFGIAKILQPGERRHTVAVTRTMERLLTPAYASPEQVLGTAVTTVSDVYSLGVILYELLTGVSPHIFEGSSTTEVERVVCTVEPERPSQALRRRLGTSDSAVIAAARRLGAERLVRRLQGDLDTIVMTALRKEPERRYQSVEALSEDLRRLGSGLPVKARPDTVRYRASKFVRRHRAAVAASAVGFAAMLIFAVDAEVNARRAAQERDRALVAEDRARVEAQTAARVSTFLVELFEEADPSESRGEEMTVRQLLDRGAERLENELADEPATRARLLETVGRVYSSLGVYQRSVTLSEEAVELLRSLEVSGGELAASLNSLAKVYFSVGDAERARAVSNEALATARQATDGDHREIALSLNNLGWLDYEAGHFERAEQLFREALDMRQRLWGPEHEEVAETLFNLGIVALEVGRVDEAVEIIERAHTMRRRVLGDDHPQTLGGVGNVLAALEAQGNYHRGLEVVDETLPVALRIFGADHPDVAYLQVMRGRQLRFLGRIQEAEEAFREALRIERAVRGPDHPYVGYALLQIGTIQAGHKRFTEAEHSYQEALRIYHAAFPEGDRNVANILAKLAELALAEDHGADALDLARRSRRIEARLHPEGHQAVLEADALVGIALAAAGQPGEARVLLAALLPRIEAEAGAESTVARRVASTLDGLATPP